MYATRRHIVTGTLAMGAMSVFAPPCFAQDYPARPVKMLVPVPAGGITDVLARILQDYLTRKWGQTIVVDNRPGAGGNLVPRRCSSRTPRATRC